MRLLEAIALASLLGVSAASALECPGAETQFALNRCANDAFKAADAELNKVYRTLVERLEGADDIKARLTKAQRAWLAVRDAECDFMTSASEGGSIHPMLIEQCRAVQSRERTEKLKAYLDCMEADDDLACPVR
ncbi:lysozyme inhibitor LprI family protein [Terrihabitans sp. B22-R8]|uniref:lysozyme inhibitor LprI family protein n=1 Tax=Terrihabitans sp. B22-R8 TaxID=3425128 RepID=UPI00403C6001